MKKLLLLLLTNILIINTFAQYPQQFGQNRQMQQSKLAQYFQQLEPGKALIIGKIVDQNQNPIPYTTIRLFKNDSTLVDGALSDTTGFFAIVNVPKGQYWLEAKFIGFKKKIITNINVDGKQRVIKIGKIVLQPVAQELEEVVVEAQRSDIEYYVDKKVINVSQSLSSVSGTAVDLLQNVPSVEVDIQGNVTLRGSSNFTVLIDGKPSVLDGSEALQQIPATDVEKIEIITNPSAKYDPDGVAGIINIITKKNKTSGLSGIINISYDTYGSFRSNSMVAYKTNKFNFLIGFNKNVRQRKAFTQSQRKIYTDTTLYQYLSSGYSNFSRGNWILKAGFDYYLNNKTTISLSGEFGQRQFKMYTSDSVTETFYLYQNIIQQNYLFQYGYADAKGYSYKAQIDFQHKFNNNGHQLTGYAYISNWMPDRVNGTVIDSVESDWIRTRIDYSQESREKRTGLKARLQLDYQLPINRFTKLEAGLTTRFMRMTSDYHFFVDFTGVDDWVEDPNRANYLIFNRLIQAGYATFSSKLLNLFQYQLGLRAEFVDRTITQLATNQTYNIKRLDLFPTIHINKNIGKSTFIQLGYSRRINRPNGWMLNPFPLYLNQNSIMQGNPELNPELADLLELNFIKYFNQSYISLEAFARKTKNKFQRIQYPTENQVILTTWTNAGSDLALGSEISLNIKLKQLITINASTSIYYYEITGQLFEDYVNTSAWTWNSRLMLMTNISPTTKFQANIIYRAPTVSLQGYRMAMFMNQFAVKQNLWKRRLSITLSVSDPFKLTRMGYITDIQGLYVENLYIMDSPLYSINLTLNLNNFKQNRRQRPDTDISEFEGEAIY